MTQTPSFTLTTVMQMNTLLQAQIQVSPSQAPSEVGAKQHRHSIAQFSTISFIILRKIKVEARKSGKIKYGKTAILDWFAEDTLV